MQNKKDQQLVEFSALTTPQMPAKSDSLLANSICTEINEWLLI